MEDNYLLRPIVLFRCQYQLISHHLVKLCWKENKFWVALPFRPPWQRSWKSVHQFFGTTKKR